MRRLPITPNLRIYGTFRRYRGHWVGLGRIGSAAYDPLPTLVVPNGQMAILAPTLRPDLRDCPFQGPRRAYKISEAARWSGSAEFAVRSEGQQSRLSAGI